MSAPSAHCSRVLSVLPGSTLRKNHLNGAALDRYSVIRNFFRSQTVALPALPKPNPTTTTTKAWTGSEPGRMTCERRKSLSSYFGEGDRSSRKGSVQLQLRVGVGDTRLLGRRLFSSSVGLNLKLSHGSTRRLHASAVFLNSDGARGKPEQPDPRPQSQRSASEPDEPPIPKQEHGQSQPCTCANGSPKSPSSTTPSQPEPKSSQSQSSQHQPIDPANPPKHLEDYSRFFRRLALSLPHPHRPTRDDFLNVATGFWERLRIRFKWFTIKSFRKFNADDISAFVTWFLMSQTLWILVGT